MDPSAIQPTSPVVTARYHYDRSYQVRILSLLVRYQNFIHRYGEVVKPEYFETDDLSAMCRLMLEFFHRYHVHPSYETFTAWVRDWCEKYHVPEAVRQGYYQLIYSLFTLDLSDGDAVRDTAIEFAKRQALKLALMGVSDLLDRHDGYDGASTLIQRALLTGQGLGNFGTELYTTIPMLPGLIAADSPYAIHRRIPTIFPSLNAARYGGLGPGECMVIVGSSGQGKSIMKNCNLHLAVQHSPGSWGAHATLELGEVDNHLRYAARALNIDQGEIIQNSQDFQQRAMRLPQDLRLYVKKFPPVVTNAQHIRSWISMVSSELGCGPCALVVDYPDLMSPAKGMIGNLYVDFGNVYAELLAILEDYKIPGYFSSQLDRYHQYSNDSRAGNMANSIAKLYHADVVGTINQSETDKQRGLGRIWWDKCRRGRDMFYTYFRINYARASVIEDEGVAQEIEQPRQARGGNRSQGNPDIPLTPAMRQ